MIWVITMAEDITVSVLKEAEEDYERYLKKAGLGEMTEKQVLLHMTMFAGRYLSTLKDEEYGLKMEMLCWGYYNKRIAELNYQEKSENKEKKYADKKSE